MQNGRLKEIDCIWDFDYHGAEFSIIDFRRHLNDGPWPLLVFQELDRSLESIHERSSCV